MKLNTIQQMMADTGMLEIKLPVTHDTYEYDVVVNGVQCECGYKEHPYLIHYICDTAWCDACFEHYN